jgi:predicted nuclease with TOPRIM domain
LESPEGNGLSFGTGLSRFDRTLGGALGALVPMIDIGIYLALGFLVASLLALLVTRPLWNRAVRLTTRRIEATMPMSLADIEAEKDQLRAEFAIELRRVEVALEKAKDKAARELVEANKRRVEISEIKTELEAVKGRLQEKENANRVLEQTIRRRLPELESRLKAAREAITGLESANAELRNTITSQGDALKLARETVSSQRGDIDQLRGALGSDTAPSRRSAKSDAALTRENQRLSAELSALKEQLTQGKIGGRENELLRQELGKLAGQVLAVAKAQGTELPAVPAPEIGLSPIADFAAEPRDREPMLIGNGGGHAEPGPAPAEAPLGASTEDDTQEEIEDGERAAQGSLAKILSARKARRRGTRGGRRGGSLAERLKDVSADASEN